MNYGYNTPNYINPYGRTNYNLNNYVQPQYPAQSQQMMQQPQQQIQYEMPFNYFGYGNYKEVESHMLFPNQKAIFIDRANNMIYEKVCNNDGISIINQYKRIENKGENQAVETKKDTSTIDLSLYVLKSDLGAFVSLEEYKQLLGKVEQLQKQIMGANNVSTEQP